MKEGEFYLDWETYFSQAWLTERPKIGLPKRNITTHSLVGAGQEAILDEGSYSNRNAELEIGLRGRDYGELETVKNKLVAKLLQPKYLPIVFYTDPDFYYLGALSDTIQTDRPVRNNNFLILSVKLTMAAYKYEIGDHVVDAATGMVITNEYNYTAAPLITLFGNGDQILTVNGTQYKIKNLNSMAVLDCDETQQDAYIPGAPDHGELMSRLSFKEFPKLVTGQNNIEWKGSRITVNPRWRTI